MHSIVLSMPTAPTTYTTPSPTATTPKPAHAHRLLDMQEAGSVDFGLADRDRGRGRGSDLTGAAATTGADTAAGHGCAATTIMVSLNVRTPHQRTASQPPASNPQPRCCDGAMPVEGCSGGYARGPPKLRGRNEHEPLEPMHALSTDRRRTLPCAALATSRCACNPQS